MSFRGSERGRGRGRGAGGFGERGRGGPSRGGFGGGGRGGSAGGVYAPPGRQANIDSRLLDKSQDELVSRLKATKIEETEMPLRPDFGTAGRAVKLRTNHFPIIKVPKGPFYEYDVSLSPSVSLRRVKRRIFQLAEQTRDWKASLAGSVAHDHSAKLVACRKLPQPLTIRVPYYDEDEDGPTTGGREYTLSIKYIQELETESLQRFLSGDPQYRNYDIMPIVSALNLILAAFPNRSGGGGVMVGRNKFFIPSGGPSMSLGGGLEAVRGFYSSVRTSHKQLMVNVNVCTTAFYKPGNLAVAMQEFMNMSFNARPNTFVKGLRIKTTHLGYRKTIKKIANVTARTHSFDSGDYGRVTVEQYFLKKYKIKLKYPDLALVDVGGQKANLLPPEVCEILPDQAFRGKLLDEHTASMITYAAKPPNENASAIENQGLSELGFKQNASPLGAFGVGIGKEMAVVPGRILPSPRIQYGHGTPLVDDRASWNLKDVRFARGARLENWAVLLIRDGSTRDEFQSTTDPELFQVLRGFMSMCSKSGMVVGKDLPPVIEALLPRKSHEDPIRGRAIGVIRDALMKTKKKPAIVLVILSNGDKHIYSGLKHLCDVYLDVATVCVHASKIRKEKGQLQYFANVALKFNMKLGGINHSLDKSSMTWLNEKATMLVGIDVTHPGFGTVKGTPSIAAVVASVDQFYAQYPASMEIQESKKEMVTNLERMMVERLTLYRNKSRTLPDRILVYRDGVSEGQFQIVIDQEMPAIIAAFKRFSTPQKSYRPKLTIVICGKRHHTRFYPTESENADMNGNPKAGTVVDRGVTSVYNFDFFLQAHGGLQGTTKPTHYYVVHDEIGFNADKLQTLTNAVSYMFARATKAVSLVSPAYYADLACERGRCYLHKLLSGISSSASTAASGADEEQVYKEAANVWKNGVAGPNLKDTMYYL